LIHRPAQHGYSENSGARAAEELVALAQAQGTTVVEPFQGVGGLGGTLLVAGPTPGYYEEMLAAQETTQKEATAAPSFAERYFGGAVQMATATLRKALDAFPAEIFFDDAGGTNPRNNSAVILSLLIDDKHFLLPSDTGVPALSAALDYLDAQGRTSCPLRMFALPHHGSRHNIDRDTIDRVLGQPGSQGTAVASVSAQSPKYPSPRVANAAGRRGYPVYTTAGKTLQIASSDAPPRNGWGPADPLPPLDEDDHDE
jgi:hypothetical protein